MKSFVLLSAEERKAELRSVIRSRAGTISDSRLNLILDRLNVNRIYYIKVLQCPKKFLNIVTSECIGAADKKLYSITIPLYGTFSEGYFYRSESEKGILPGSIDTALPAAAVKITLENTAGRITKTYTLAIYEPDGVGESVI